MNDLYVRRDTYFPCSWELQLNRRCGDKLIEISPFPAFMVFEK